MAQLMKQTLVFGAGVVGLSTLTRVASADTEAKPMTLAEVKAENAKRIAAYESEKQGVDERNRVKRAQYRDAYAHYAEFATRGATEPKEPEYEALPTLELLEEPIELPFDAADATPREVTFEHADKVVVKEPSSSTTSETNETDDTSVSNGATSEMKETGEKLPSDTTISEIKGVVDNKLSDTGVPEKETGKKDAEPNAETPETKETGKKDAEPNAETPETKETGEKTLSDAVAAQLNAEKTSSDAVAAQLNKESEKTTTSSADAAAQISKIESEKTSDTTKSEIPSETTSSADAATQVAKLEDEKAKTTKSEDSTPATKSDTDTTKTDDVKNDNSQTRNLSDTAEKSNNAESTTKDKTQESLPHTGDSGSLVSLLGVALSGLSGISLRRKRK